MWPAHLLLAAVAAGCWLLILPVCARDCCSQRANMHVACHLLLAAEPLVFADAAALLTTIRFRPWGDFSC